MNKALTVLGYLLLRIGAVAFVYFLIKWGFHYTMNPFEVYATFLIQGIHAKD